ncbi:MAG: 50S ribosomal protein L21 [Gammaproteobacteria bacterium]|nr:50S ribosomal protein L21 [Gammaproteobacteria bacterium]
MLITGGTDGEPEVGTPTVEGAAVRAEALAHGKDRKLIVFKRKRRKGYRKKQGHRQKFTEVRIDEIVTSKRSEPKRKPEMAHKKGVGSSRNGRDSKPKFLASTRRRPVSLPANRLV